MVQIGADFIHFLLYFAIAEQNLFNDVSLNFHRLPNICADFGAFMITTGTDKAPRLLKINYERLRIIFECFPITRSSQIKNLTLCFYLGH